MRDRTGFRYKATVWYYETSRALKYHWSWNWPEYAFYGLALTVYGVYRLVTL